MSLNRLIYYGAILGGWSAFVGWLLAELLFAGGSRSEGFLAAVLLAAFVGAAVAGALSILPALRNSFIVASSVTAVVLAVGAVAAYTYARLQFAGRDLTYAFILTSRLIPAISVAMAATRPIRAGPATHASPCSSW